MAVHLPPGLPGPPMANGGAGSVAMQKRWVLRLWRRVLEEVEGWFWVCVGSRTWPRRARLADTRGVALEVVRGLIVLAGLVRQPVALHVFEHASHITALARPAAATVNENLNGQSWSACMNRMSTRGLGSAQGSRMYLQTLESTSRVHCVRK